MDRQIKKKSKVVRVGEGKGARQKQKGNGKDLKSGPIVRLLIDEYRYS